MSLDTTTVKLDTSGLQGAGLGDSVGAAIRNRMELAEDMEEGSAKSEEDGGENNGEVEVGDSDEAGERGEGGTP